MGAIDMEVINKTGWIEIVCGPMFAGKSEELIRRIKRLEYAKRKMLIFKPDIDNRYSDSDIVSHSNAKVPSIVIKASSEILKHIRSDTEAIVVDEVQFLDHGIIDVVEVLANRGIRVIVGGLDLDFKGEPFPITAAIMAKAEFITKLTAVCVCCGAPATRTQRLIKGQIASYDDPVVVVGAKESYEPRCRHCHKIVKGV
jgi:thymidine kinase